MCVIAKTSYNNIQERQSKLRYGSLWCHLHLPSNIYDLMIQVSSNTSVLYSKNIYCTTYIHKLHFNTKSYAHFFCIIKDRQQYSVCFDGTQPALTHQPACCCCVCVGEGGGEGGSICLPCINKFSEITISQVYSTLVA